MKDESKTVPVSLSPEEAPTYVRPSSTHVGTADTWIRPSAQEQEELTVPPSGRTLAGRYMVLEQLGQGGMSVVVAAYDTRLDRRVALKLLRAEPSLEASTSDGQIRLVREAQAMARLN